MGGQNVVFVQQRFTWDSNNNLEYLGSHAINGVSESDPSWHIWKFTWTSGNLTKIHGPMRGAWTNRTNLAWT
jgi:YD repeat-containing protein